ncbi:MAG: 3-dehydroquinate synthase [Flavobacteriaceae bacterium]|nr:3-dehydroquinate synthase [Flavobacteriaceae bacterium]
MRQSPVFFNNNFIELKEFINANKEAMYFFLVDENTHEFCLPLLLAELDEISEIEIIEVPVGEDSKSIEIVYHICQTLADFGADRNSVLINCGGGVVTDLGGFVASIFKRGIRFIQVPTTLLAMVDASVGGKTGINLNQAKNQIGTYNQPELIIFSTEFLQTLPYDELLSGFAEMLKHALIRDKNLWNQMLELKEISPENLTPFIPSSIKIKQEIVEKDPKESNLRKILNAGHTIGHALESWYMDKNPITHGHAVAAGLLLESYISYQLKILPKNEFYAILYGLNLFYPLLELPDSEQILPYLIQDKKNEKNQIKCVLINEIGNAKDDIYTIDLQLVKDAFSFYKTL